MPDITMCHGEGCAIKNLCYRHRAIPSEHRQSYFAESPIKSDFKCDYFWQVEKTDRLNAKENDGMD